MLRNASPLSFSDICRDIATPVDRSDLLSKLAPLNEDMVVGIVAAVIHRDINRSGTPSRSDRHQRFTVILVGKSLWTTVVKLLPTIFAQYVSDIDSVLDIVCNNGVGAESLNALPACSVALYNEGWIEGSEGFVDLMRIVLTATGWLMPVGSSFLNQDFRLHPSFWGRPGTEAEFDQLAAIITMPEAQQIEARKQLAINDANDGEATTEEPSDGSFGTNVSLNATAATNANVGPSAKVCVTQPLPGSIDNNAPPRAVGAVGAPAVSTVEAKQAAKRVLQAVTTSSVQAAAQVDIITGLKNELSDVTSERERLDKLVASKKRESIKQEASITDLKKAVKKAKAGRKADNRDLTEIVNQLHRKIEELEAHAGGEVAVPPPPPLRRRGGDVTKVNGIIKRPLPMQVFTKDVGFSNPMSRKEVQQAVAKAVSTAAQQYLADQLKFLRYVPVEELTDMVDGGLVDGFLAPFVVQLGKIQGMLEVAGLTKLEMESVPINSMIHALFAPLVGVAISRAPRFSIGDESSVSLARKLVGSISDLCLQCGAVLSFDRVTRRPIHPKPVGHRGQWSGKLSECPFNGIVCSTCSDFKGALGLKELRCERHGPALCPFKNGGRHLGRLGQWLKSRGMEKIRASPKRAVFPSFFSEEEDHKAGPSGESNKKRRGN